MDRITMDEVIRLHCQNAELKAELRLTQQQLAQANASVTFLVNNLRTFQQPSESQRNLAILQSGHLQAHPTPSPLQSLSQFSYGANPDDLLSFDGDFTPQLDSTASTLTSTPIQSIEREDGQANKTSQLAYKVCRPEASFRTAEQTPDTIRSRTNFTPRFTDAEHRRLQGLVTFINDEEDMESYWRLYARRHPEHTATQWQEYFDANFKQEHSKVIAEDEQQLIQLDHEVTSQRSVEAVESKPKIDEAKVEQIDVQDQHQDQMGTELPDEVKEPSKDVPNKTEFCTVIISNIPTDTTLAEVLDKVTGGKILSATYLSTAGMRLKGGHTITANGAMISLWRESAAKRFVEASNTTNLTFIHKTQGISFTANVSFVRTQMCPPHPQLAIDIVQHNMSRIFFIVGDLKPEYYAERIMSLDRTKLIRQRPLRVTKDDVGRIVLEFARIIDAANAWTVVERDDSVFQDAQKGFLPDPCDVDGEDEFDDTKGSTGTAKDVSGGSHTSESSWPAGMEKPNCQPS